MERELKTGAGAVRDLGTHMGDTGGKTRLFGQMLQANLASEAIVAGVASIGRAIQSVGRKMVETVRAGISYNAQMEQYTTSFTTMLGEQARAQQVVNNLREFAAKTPFGLSDIAKNTQTLLSFGISADEALVRIRQIGDVSQGNAERMGALTLAFAQVSSAGKLSGQDLLQMINAGFNPLEEISRKTGKSMAELKTEMAKGAISAEMVADAFASATSEGGRFYGSLEAQSKTFTGQMSTLKDGAEELRGLLVGAFTAALAGSVLPMVNGWISAFTAAFQTEGVAGVISVLGQIVPQMLQFLLSQLPQLVQGVGVFVSSFSTAFATMLPQVVPLFSSVISSMVSGVSSVLPQFVQVLSQMVTGLTASVGQALPQIIPAIVSAVTGMVQALVVNAPMFLEAALQLVSGLVEGFMLAGPTLVGMLPGLIQGLVDFIVNAVPQIVEAGILLFEALVQALPVAVTAIVGALPQIISSIVGGLALLVPQLVNAGVELFLALIRNLPLVIVSIVDALPQIIIAIVQGIFGAIPQLQQAGFQLLTTIPHAILNTVQTVSGAMWELLGRLVGAVWENIGRVGSAAWELIQAVPRSIYNGIGAAVGAIWAVLDHVFGAVGSGFGRMWDAGANIVRGLWEGIQNMAGWIFRRVQDFCAGIWNRVTSFFGIHSPSKKFEWAAEMLTLGLGGGLEKNGWRAVQAAKGLATDVTDAMTGAATSFEVPVRAAVTPFGAAHPVVAGGGVVGSGGDVSVEAVATRAAKAVIERLNIDVRLSDGALVGKLANRFDEHAREHRHEQSMLSFR